MDYPISHQSLVNVSRLGIVHFEGVVRAMSVGFPCQRFMEIDEIVYEVEFEELDVALLGLASFEVFPGEK